MNSKNVELIDLLRSVLLRWKIIISIAFLVATITASISYYVSYDHNKQDKSIEEEYKNSSIEKKKEQYLDEINKIDFDKTVILSVISNENQIEYDKTLLEGKTDQNFINGVNKEISNLEYGNAALLSGMSKTQREYYEFLKNGIVPQKNFDITIAQIDKKKVISYSLISVIFVIVVLIFKYLTSGKLRFVDNVFDYYGIMCIDKISFAQKGFAKLNRMRMKADEQIEVAAFDINLIAKTSKVDTVVILGHRIDDSTIDSIIQNIKKKLEKSNIKIDIINADFESSQQIERLSCEKMVVLIELCEKTRDKEILNTIEVINKYNIKNVGMIVVEK